MVAQAQEGLKRELFVKKSLKIWLFQKKLISLHRESEISESRCFVVCTSNIFRGVGTTG